MESRKFSLRERIKSFQFAFEGIGRFLRHEHNARIHLLATILVIILAWIYRVSSLEAALLTLTIALVWVAEMINTCLEKAMDFITEERREPIQFIKDIAAGAVLVASIAAVLTGLFIFIPKIV
jgi:diacylglycerol kinase (ATP)